MIDYSVWDLKDEFTFNESAHLWYEIDPSTHPSDAPNETIIKIKTFYNVLHEMALNSKIGGVTFIYHPRPKGLEVADKLTRTGLKELAVYIGQKPKFLFPEEREKQLGQQGGNKNTENESPTFKHSPDYRSVSHKGIKYSFTTKQAKVVEFLYEQYKDKIPEVSDAYIIENILENNTSKLKDTFKNCPAWGTLIVKGKTKGSRRLDI